MEAGWAGGVQDRGDPNYDSDVEADRHMRLKSIPIDNTAGCKKEVRLIRGLQICVSRNLERPTMRFGMCVGGEHCCRVSDHRRCHRSDRLPPGDYSCHQMTLN